MTALVTGDLHLSDNPRDAYRHRLMAELPAKAKRSQVDQIIILGDITEEKDRHSAWLVNKVCDHIVALAQVAPVIIKKGNHDYKDIESPFFEFLKRMPNVHWINHPTNSEDLEPPLVGLGRCLFLPHTLNYKEEWRVFLNRRSKFDSYDWVFAHNTFAGATGDNGRTLSGIPLDIFGTTKVIAGDIHKPQSFGVLTYVGSPYLVDFGDDFEPRALLVDRKSKKSLPLEGPQKRLVHVSSVADLKKQTQVNKGDILKVRVDLDPAQHAEWPEIQEKVREWGAKIGAEIHTVQPVVDTASRMLTKSKRKVKLRTDEELLNAYAGVRAIDEVTLKTGHRLARKV